MSSCMRTPIDFQQALVEDSNVYFIDISKFPQAGWTVKLEVNGEQCAYEPALTYDRALQKAERL